MGRRAQLGPSLHVFVFQERQTLPCLMPPCNPMRRPPVADFMRTHANCDGLPWAATQPVYTPCSSACVHPMQLSPCTPHADSCKPMQTGPTHVRINKSYLGLALGADGAAGLSAAACEWVRSGMAIRAFTPPLPPPPVTLDRSAASEPAAAPPPVAPALLRSRLGLARPAVLPAAAAVLAEPAKARRSAAPVVVRSSKDPPLPAPLPGLSLSTETGRPSVDEEDTRLKVPAPAPAPSPLPPPRALSTDTDRCRKEGPWPPKPEVEGCLAAAARDGDGERRTLLVEAQRPATAAADAGRSGSRRLTEPRSSADARMAAPLPPPPPPAEVVCLVWAPPAPRGEAAETRPPKATLTPLLILPPPWWWWW